MLTAERLRELLQYAPDTGAFTWRVTRGTRRAGATAGSPVSSGYLNISIDYRLHKAHRLAWLYVHGRWPTHQIDHINGDRSDNRLANLREASGTQNGANSRRRSDNTSRFKGVSWKARNKRWVAYISIDGKAKHLGLFDTAEAAHAAYVAAARDAYGEFARGE